MMVFFYTYKKSKSFRSPIAVRQAGFTMVEVLISLTILATGLMIFSLITLTIGVVLDTVAQNIRMAGLDPFGGAGAEIKEFKADKIQFSLDRCDIPIGTQGCGFPDGDVDDKFENVTYQWDAAERKLKQVLYEGTGSAYTETLIENVSNLQFTYLDNDNGAPTTAADIRTVIISLTVTDPAGRGGTVSRTYSTRVRCRNLGL